MEYNIKEVELFIEQDGLNQRNRRRDIVDKRTYLSKYMRSKGETFHKIGLLFNLHHSTVIHAVNKYDDIHTSLDFILNCSDLIIEFPIIGDMADFKDKLSKNNKVMLNLNSDEYLALQSYRIDNMIYTNENAIKHLIANANNF